MTPRPPCANHLGAAVMEKHYSMKSLSLSVAAVVLWGLAADARAQEVPAELVERQVAEPIVTEEVLPNEVGEWDLRWSNEYRRHATGSTMQAPRFQLFFGITDRLGGDVDAAFVVARDEARRYGPGDVETSLKWLLVAPGGDAPAITIGFGLGWPTGNLEKRTGEGAVEVHPFVGLLKQFGGFNVQGDIGWARTITGEETEVAVPYNWAFTVPLDRPNTALMLEINGRVGRDGEPSPVAAAPGIRYGLRRGMSIALAVPIGLTSRSDRWGVVTQLQAGF